MIRFPVLPFLGRHFAQPRGGKRSTVETAGSGISSIEMMAALCGGQQLMSSLAQWRAA